MSALLQPSANRRVTVDRVFGLGDGRHLYQLGEEFFYPTGEFLRDAKVAEGLPEPHRARALAFVAKVVKHDATHAKAEAVVDTAVPPPVIKQVGEAKGIVEVQPSSTVKLAGE